MKKLNDKQREFIEYVRDKHLCLGNQSTIDRILKNGEYNNNDDLQGIQSIVEHYRNLLCELNGGAAHYWYNIGEYGTPTKYLKG